jgi:hypothetical protein
LRPAPLRTLAILGVFAALLVIGVPTAQAQDSAKAKLTIKERIHQMMSKWRQNQPKLAACRNEACKKGLAGDDRWFFISNCMEKS